MAGTLAYGLRPDSRIVMKAANMKAPFSEMVMMRAVDELALIRWLNTKDGKDGVNRPKLLSAMFSDNYAEPEAEGYDTPEEFMRNYYGE